MDTIAATSRVFETVPTKIEEWPIGHFLPSRLNPRKTFDPAALEGLAASIARDGILQPLLARPNTRQGGDMLEIIAGERRYRATKIAIGKKLLPPTFKLPVIVHDCSDADLLLFAGTENLQRDDLHPLEWAQYFEQLKNAGIDYKEAAARLNIPHRTVTRRVRLLRCIPEVQKAFREGKITGQQAEAFAEGDEAAQRKLVKIGAIKRDFDPDRIAAEITDDLMPVAVAFFERAQYAGEIIETPDGDEYFADQAQATKLQQAAIDAKKAELEKKWSWVEIVEGYRWSVEQQYPRASNPKDSDAGAIIIIDTGEPPVVREGVLSPKVAESRRKDKALVERADKNQAAGKNRMLTADQVIAIKRAKTQALRRAVHDHPKVGLVLAIMGIATFGQEIDLRTETARGAQFSFDPTPADETLHKEHATVTLGSKRVTLSSDDERILDAAGCDNEEKLARTFATLLALPIDRLHQILAALMAELVGARCHGTGWSPADSPFEIALAKATVAEHYIDQYWTPTADFFRPFNRTRLVALGHYPGVGAPVDFDTWKKGKMVEFLAGKPKGYWKAALFPELRHFTDEKTMRAAVKDQIADAKIAKNALIAKTKTALKAATMKPAPKKAPTKANATAKPKAKTAKKKAR